MHSLTFAIRYRPIRIGWCVRANDFAAFRKIVRQNLTLWGGGRNPIIVVDDEVTAKAIVDTANVDILFSQSPDDPVIRDFVAAFPHLPLVDLEYRDGLFSKDAGGEYEPQFLDVVSSARHRAKAAQADPREEHMQLSMAKWDSDDPLRDALLLNYGAFPESDEPGHGLKVQVEEIHRVDDVDLRGRAPLMRDSDRWHGIRYLSVRGLELEVDDWSHQVYPGVFIGATDNFYDLVNYWNVRASGQQLIFFDPSNADRMRDFRDGRLAWLLLHTPPTKMAVKEIGVWSRAKPDLEGWNVPKEMVVWHQLEADRLNSVDVPLWYFPEQTALASVGSDRFGFTATIPLPATPFELQRFDHRAVAISLRPGFGRFEDEALTFRTPFVRRLNRFYGEKLLLLWYAARIERRGISTLTNFTRDALTLKALQVSEVVRELFKVHGIKAEFCKAGLVAQRVASQMGGIDSCRAFRVKGLRTLIEDTRPDASFTRSHAIQTIRDQRDDGTVGFAQYERLYIEPRERGPLKPEHVFQYVLKRGAFRIGLELRCTECSLESWVSLENAGTTVMCEYCGKRFDVTGQIKDRDWRYRRSGVFGKDDSQEGAIPVILTLLRLQHLDHASPLLYAPALTLTSGGADIPDCETDFAMIDTKRFQGEERASLVIGECKTRNPITAQDVANLRAVAEIFEAVGIPTYIVFSKLAEFSAEELTEIAKVNSGHRQRAIVLTPKELEPWFPYQWAEKKGERTFHGISIQSLAEATEALYLR